MAGLRRRTARTGPLPFAWCMDDALGNPASQKSHAACHNSYTVTWDHPLKGQRVHCVCDCHGDRPQYLMADGSPVPESKAWVSRASLQAVETDTDMDTTDGDPDAVESPSVS